MSFLLWQSNLYTGQKFIQDGRCAHCKQIGQVKQTDDSRIPPLLICETCKLIWIIPSQEYGREFREKKKLRGRKL